MYYFEIETQLEQFWVISALCLVQVHAQNLTFIGKPMTPYTGQTPKTFPTDFRNLCLLGFRGAPKVILRPSEILTKSQIWLYLTVWTLKWADIRQICQTNHLTKCNTSICWNEKKTEVASCTATPQSTFLASCSVSMEFKTCRVTVPIHRRICGVKVQQSFVQKAYQNPMTSNHIRNNTHVLPGQHRPRPSVCTSVIWRLNR